MRNIAKCKLCNSIIESFHSTDYVTCKCDEIFVDGGDALRCGAKDWNNFIRVDDEGNEIVVKIQNKLNSQEYQNKSEIHIPSKPTKNDMLEMLDEMIKSYERLPQHAMLTSVTQADLLSVLLLFSSILRSD